MDPKYAVSGGSLVAVDVGQCAGAAEAHLAANVGGVGVVGQQHAELGGGFLEGVSLAAGVENILIGPGGRQGRHGTCQDHIKGQGPTAESSKQFVERPHCSIASHRLSRAPLGGGRQRSHHAVSAATPSLGRRVIRCRLRVRPEAPAS